MTHRPTTIVRICALLLGSIAITSCSTPPTLTHPERFYLQAPCTKSFTYERLLPEGGWIKGTLTVVIDEVTLADGDDGTYRMAGTAELVSRGLINDRQDARLAPQRVVQAAMEPDNVPEVFETESSQPGVSVTHFHWDRLRTLQLPLDFEHNIPASRFSSSLRGSALDDAVEVALVWHKAIALFTGLPPFGTYSASNVDEQAETLEVTLSQAFSGGAPVRLRYRFERGRGLSAIETTLMDGSVLRIESSE